MYITTRYACIQKRDSESLSLKPLRSCHCKACQSSFKVVVGLLYKPCHGKSNGKDVTTFSSYLAFAVTMAGRDLGNISLPCDPWINFRAIDGNISLALFLPFVLRHIKTVIVNLGIVYQFKFTFIPFLVSLNLIDMFNMLQLFIISR